MEYKAHGCIRRTPISAGQIKEKILLKQCTYIKSDKINIMNIFNDDTFNLHNSLLNNDNRFMKVTLKSKLKGTTYNIEYKTRSNFKIYF